MKKIILASSSESFIERNSNLLMRRGIQLFPVTSGRTALKLYSDVDIDLILADMELKDMDGSNFCTLIRRVVNLQHVPVIVACQNNTACIEDVNQSGATTILLKPIDPVQLMKIVGSFIDLKLVRSKRVQFRINAICRIGDMEISCRAHDISNTGILIETEHQLALKSRIVCQFTLHDSYHVETEGEVMRIISASEAKNHYGVQFIDLPLSYHRAIDSYVASNANHDTTTPKRRWTGI